MCIKDGNNNKGCYIPPNTYIGIIYVPDNTSCLVILVTPSWNHTLWWDDLHLSGVHVCLFTQGRIFCFTNPYFSLHEHIIFVVLFIKICNIPTCSLK